MADQPALSCPSGMRGRERSFFAKSFSLRMTCSDSGKSAVTQTRRIHGPKTAFQAPEPMPATVYFDFNATTPLDPAVREAMLPYLGENYGNPSSVHHVGRRARALLDDARDRVAAVWSCRPSEVVFTSGGTESVNLAIFGSARQGRHRGRHIITSAA